MKTLLAVSALLTAALAAFLVPEMKTYLAFIPFALLALATGCSTADFKKKLRDLPDGHYESILISQKNLGVGPELNATNLTLKGNDISFDLLSLEANTPWLGTGKIVLKGGSMDVSPASRTKKPAAIPPLTPQNSAPVLPEKFTLSYLPGRAESEAARAAREARAARANEIPPKTAQAAPADPAPVAATAPAATGTPDAK